MSIAPTSALLVHGFLDRASVWKAFGERLTEAGLQVLAPDLAGAGGRAGDLGPFALGRAADELVALIDERPSETLLLVGHSMGGQIAEVVASKRPDHIATLVLMTAVPLAGRALPDEARQLQRGAGGDIDTQRRIREMFSVNLSPAQMDVLLAQSGLMGARAAEGYYDAFTAGDPTGLLPPIFSGPVMVLAAAGDQIVTVDEAQAMRSERFGAAAWSVIEKSGHWVHLEQPGAAAEAVLSFAGAIGGEA